METLSTTAEYTDLECPFHCSQLSQPVWICGVIPTLQALRVTQLEVGGHGVYATHQGGVVQLGGLYYGVAEHLTVVQCLEGGNQNSMLGLHISDLFFFNLANLNNSEHERSLPVLSFI